MFITSSRPAWKRKLARKGLTFHFCATSTWHAWLQNTRASISMFLSVVWLRKLQNISNLEDCKLGSTRIKTIEKQSFFNFCKFRGFEKLFFNFFPKKNVFSVGKQREEYGTDLSRSRRVARRNCGVKIPLRSLSQIDAVFLSWEDKRSNVLF